MNNSFYRFKLLFRKQWAEDKRMYLSGLMVIGLLQLAMMLLMVYTGDNGLSKNNAIIMGTMGLILSGSIFSSILLNRFRHKSEAIFAFMLPASAKEKLLVAIVFGLILFPLAYQLLFFINLSIADVLDRRQRQEPTAGMSIGYDNAIMLLLMFWLSQAFVLLCSIMFRKRAFLISIAFIFVTTIVVTSSVSVIMKKMVGERLPARHTNAGFGTEIIAAKLSSANPLSDVTYDLEVKKDNTADSARWTEYLQITLPYPRLILFYSALLITIIFLLYIVWFKLKEQQL